MARKFNKESWMPDNYLYISHLDEDQQFWLLPVSPEEISDSMSSTFAETTALGRTAPVWTYSNSGPRTVQINLKFHREMFNDVNFGVSNAKPINGEDYLDALINALRAIVLPSYNRDNKAIQPPMVALRLGADIFIKGIVNGNIGLAFGLPILYNNKYAEVSLSLEITEIDPYDSSTVFSNGGFRGAVSTLRSGMGLEVTRTNGGTGGK